MSILIDLSAKDWSAECAKVEKQLERDAKAAERWTAFAAECRERNERMVREYAQPVRQERARRWRFWGWW